MLTQRRYTRGNLNILAWASKAYTIQDLLPGSVPILSIKLLYIALVAVRYISLLNYSYKKNHNLVQQASVEMPTGYSLIIFVGFPYFA